MNSLRLVAASAYVPGRSSLCQNASQKQIVYWDYAIQAQREATTSWTLLKETKAYAKQKSIELTNEGNAAFDMTVSYTAPFQGMVLFAGAQLYFKGSFYCPLKRSFIHSMLAQD